MSTRSTSPFNPDFPGLLSRVWFSAGLMLLLVPCLFGQADSRAEEIQREREEAHSQAQPETMNRVEKSIFQIEDKKLLRRINSGWSGLRVKIGGLPAGGGCAAGPEYHRDDLLSRNLNFRTSAELSTTVYHCVAEISREEEGKTVFVRIRAGAA
jgi:hypothetical protein